MSTTSGNTNLVNTEDNTKVIETLPTLAGGYTDSTFIANKWGYKKNRNTDNYNSFPATQTLLENDERTNEDIASLRFGTKIDYLQESGTYATNIEFNLVANPLVDYMQNLNPALCTTTPMTVVDKRDNKEYTIARLKDGQCWMTSNLNLAGGTTLNASDSDVPTDNYFTLPASSATGFDDDTKAYVYNTGNETTSQADCTSTQACNSYYSWLAATAGGKDASGNAVTGNGPDTAYSVCPKNWRLPKSGNQSDTSATSTTGYKKGDFYKLATAYGANLESSYYQNTTAFNTNAGPGTLPNFLLAGYYLSSSFYNGGTRGYYWSSSSYSSTNAYDLYFYSSYVYSASRDTRRYGFSVRCILNDSRTISDITTMQEINSQIVANTAEGATTTLKDSRDGQDYTIAKINGNVWMTRNLAIGCDGTGSAYGSTITSKTLTSSDSNISAATWSTPTSSLKLGDSKTTPRMECSSVYGAWYNLPAATAGTIVGTSTPNNSTYDICPSGWRIQSNAEGTGIISYSNMFNAVTGGRYYGGRNDANQYGYWWSSTAYNATIRYVLAYGYNGTNLTTDTYNIPIDFGAYVRCIAK